MEIIQDSEDVFEFQTKMQDMLRALLLFLALLPLAAPYELLIHPHWGSLFNIYFFIAAVISMAAVTLSGMLVWGAISGMHIEMSFDIPTRILSYSVGAPIFRWRRESTPFEEIDGLEIETQDWDDRPPTYALVVRLKDGRIYQTGSTFAKEEAEEVLQKARQILEK